MDEIADGVFALGGFPRHAINAYLVGDVLVDARTRWARRRILRELRGRTVAAHAITHAHVDHQGASAAVCEALGVPFWVSEGDAGAAASGDLLRHMPSNLVTRWQQRNWAGPGRAVDRVLHEGDDVAGFTVLETPGHAPGHIALWRERDRVLIGGDVFFNQPRLGEPPKAFTIDPATNRESMRRLAALRPAVAAFGHGAPVRDPGALQAFVDGL
jgi:glyoxylase-like metal-dependent hydrolase (beta-lactamase superfamily II)